MVVGSHIGVWIGRNIPIGQDVRIHGQRQTKNAANEYMHMRPGRGCEEANQNQS